MLFRSKIKPILYNRSFLIKNLQEYYSLVEIPVNFEIDKSFFIDLFPKLLAMRLENYAELVQKTNGVVVNAFELEDLKNIKNLISIIYERSNGN